MIGTQFINQVFFLFSWQIKAALEDSERKCAQFRGERDNFEADVKKAFMRGVCALNLEAMAVLKPK